jgi:hypothetical protein
MSQLIFDAMIAWNQVGMLAGGAIIGGLGVLLLGSQVHWRLRAVRVSGALIGVRETRAHIYAPVYRYVLPNGVAQEGTSEVGSSSVSRLRTGATARLMVFAQHPDTVAEADRYVSEILGAAFIAVAAVLIYIAVTAWPLTPITWLVLAAIVIYTATRWRKAMPGKGERPLANPLGTAARLSADGGAAPGAKRLLQIEQIATDPATIVQQRKQQRLLQYVLPMAAAVGIALLVLGVHEFGATSKLQSDGQRSPGTIVSLEVSSGSHSTSYYPVVEFRTVEDVPVRFRDRVGSNPPSHHIGDAVTVLYLKGAPQPTAIIDRGYWNWLPALALSLFGPLLSAASLRAWLKSRKT